MVNKNDLKIECIRGKGPGGANKNKVSSCVKITHIPTGITVMKDGRDQNVNKQMALDELERRLKELVDRKKAKEKKKMRDHRINNTPIIRTYNFVRNTVKDHRSKKTASLNDVLRKGRIDLLK